MFFCLINVKLHFNSTPANTDVSEFRPLSQLEKSYVFSTKKLNGRPKKSTPLPAFSASGTHTDFYLDLRNASALVEDFTNSVRNGGAIIEFVRSKVEGGYPL